MQDIFLQVFQGVLFRWWRILGVTLHCNNREKILIHSAISLGWLRKMHLERRAPFKNGCFPHFVWCLHGFRYIDTLQAMERNDFSFCMPNFLHILTDCYLDVFIVSLCPTPIHKMKFPSYTKHLLQIPGLFARFSWAFTRDACYAYLFLVPSLRKGAKYDNHLKQGQTITPARLSPAITTNFPFCLDRRYLLPPKLLLYFNLQKIRLNQTIWQLLSYTRAGLNRDGIDLEWKEDSHKNFLSADSPI